MGRGDVNGAGRKGKGQLRQNRRMNALNVAEYTQSLGLQAKRPLALMAKAPAAIKKSIAGPGPLLREQTEALQVDNARDLERAPAPVWPSRWWTV